ncbi:unnamed protein product [Ambrosiozyma monospora]|uniref:Unnamed protein product n=1 Tax=Ambrosiozyma monospora TaxID=43982 RepID=A0A9W6YQS8_AMBMO|nr:unnamed protein product [Ambrosiozyma monospora]
MTAQYESYLHEKKYTEKLIDMAASYKPKRDLMDKLNEEYRETPMDELREIAYQMEDEDDTAALFMLSCEKKLSFYSTHCDFMKGFVDSLEKNFKANWTRMIKARNNNDYDDFDASAFF